MLLLHRSVCLVAFAVLFVVTVAGQGFAQATLVEPEPARFFADRLDSMRDHLQRLAAAALALPEDLERAVTTFRTAAKESSSGRIALGAVICLLGGLALEWAVRRATAGMLARRRTLEILSAGDRLTQIGVEALLELLAIGGFAIGMLFLLELQAGPGPIHEAGIALLLALIGIRVALSLLHLMLRPSDNSDRSLAFCDIDGAAALFWYRHLASFIGWFAIGWAVISILRAFGLPRETLQLLAYVMALGLVVIAIAVVWRQPRSAEMNEGPASNAKRWLASIAIVAFWLEWAAGLMSLFWLLIVVIGLPIAIRAARKAARHVLRPVRGGIEDEAGVPTVTSVASVLVEQGLRAALLVGAIFLLMWGWNLDFGSIAERETAFTRLLRGSMHALVILLMADLAWSLIKALADNALANARAVEGTDAEETRRRARVRTLLPIGRNIAFVVLAVMAGLMALSALGIEVAPLIASAGVVGVAVGFGAQTVVRDIISGMFYMLDDAFRVGEYIQSGTYKGTVESFSLRSVKLRHQRGPVFTVPFGVLGAVQNMSRDWVVVKDIISITHDSDVEKARKLVKQIGLDLAADPVMGPNILQPLKMQGVQTFGEYGLNVRTKMMTKPGEQFVIRRKANALIKKAFDENGIRFAVPRVQIANAGGSGSDTATTAVAAQQLLKSSSVGPQ